MEKRFGWTASGFLQAVVLAGGVGSRLRPDEHRPKACQCSTEPSSSRSSGACQPVLSMKSWWRGYRVQQITDHFAQGTRHRRDHCRESEPLGTGGALANCKDVISGRFACFNGDVITSLRMEDLLDATT